MFFKVLFPVCIFFFAKCAFFACYNRETKFTPYFTTFVLWLHVLLAAVVHLLEILYFLPK